MKAKLSTFERERNGLRVAVSAIGAQLADENWNLRMVEYHLVQHSSGIVSPNEIFKRTREVEAHSPLFSNSDANPQGRLF
jgi:hypothetical protein